MVLLVTYDLNKPYKDYPGLYKAIEAISSDYLHQLTSVWLLDTNFSPKLVFGKLRPWIDDNDELFVVRITSDYFGHLSQSAINWLKNRISF